MASQPIPQESARVILAIFKVMGFHSGAILQKDQVQLQFTVNGGNAADFSAGLRYGVDHGWFELPTTLTVKLTDGGFAESKAADHSD